MKTKRTINYPDFDLPCEICGQRFKTPQGLAGHKQFKHGSGAVIASNGHSPAGTDGSVKDLKGQVERLELEVKRRNLAAQLPSTSSGPADLMQQLGLGAFDPEVKAQAQRRAMALSGQEQHGTWLDRLLSSPEGLRTVIDGVRAIAGTGVNHGGDNAAGGLGVLKELGIDLKSVWERGQAPKSGPLEIGGMNFSGASLTPELLVALLDYKAKTEAAQKDYEGKNEMSNTLKELIKIVTPELLSRLKRAHGAAGIISQEITSEAATFVCDQCGHENELPADAVPGTVIKCQGEGCSMSWIADVPGAKQKPARQKREVAIQEPEIPLCGCPSCGQKIELTGRSIGEAIKCPVCQVEYVVQSEDLAVRAEDPESEEQKQTQQFLHR